MRNLVLILIAFIAVVTFIRAYDNVDHAQSDYGSRLEAAPVLLGAP